MERRISKFDQRQEMCRPDYEIAYKVDTDLKEVGLHHHDFYELDFLLSGSVTYAVESRVYRFMPGDILAVGPRELHQVFIDSHVEPYERYTLWLAPPLLARLSTEKTDLTRCFAGAGCGNLIRLDPARRDTAGRLMELLLRESNSDQYGADVLPEALLVRLMVFVNRMAELGGRESAHGAYTTNAMVERTIRFIDRHYGEPLTLEALAGSLYISKYHLSHEFSRYMGISVYRYLQKKRLLIARQMLAQGKAPSEVYGACGFGDYTNFYRAFRSEYGVPPREFARRAREPGFQYIEKRLPPARPDKEKRIR